MNHAHRLFPAITLTHIAVELAREAAARASLYPRRVESLRMTQAEADFQITVCHAWQGDVARLIASWFTPHPLAPASHTVSWAERRSALDREIDLRRRFYPQWIETARLTSAAAVHQIDCLMALAAIYDDGFDWVASNGSGPCFAEIIATKAMIAARREWYDHQTRVDLTRNPATQEEMMLP